MLKVGAVQMSSTSSKEACLKKAERFVFLATEIDLSLQEKIRKNLPSLSHIRKDLF